METQQTRYFAQLWRELNLVCAETRRPASQPFVADTAAPSANMGMLAGLFLAAGVLLAVAQMGAFETPQAQVDRLERLAKKVDQAHHVPPATREVLITVLEQARTSCRPGKCNAALNARHSAAVERLAIALREPESEVAVNVVDDELHSGTLNRFPSGIGASASPSLVEELLNGNAAIVPR